MLSLILIVIAGVVLYYLYITFQDYLKNPIATTQKPESYPAQPIEPTPYHNLSPVEKLKNSYIGASIALLGAVLEAGIGRGAAKDGTTTSDSNSASHLRPTPLQQILIKDYIKALTDTDIKYAPQAYPLLYGSAPNFAKEIHQDPAKILPEEQAQEPSQEPISQLARIFLDHTYGEYKKRLGFVAFLLMIAWSDRELNDKEQDTIFDIAAFLEIDNADFNALYESFELLQKNPPILESNTTSFRNALQAALESNASSAIDTQGNVQEQGAQNIQTSNIESASQSTNDHAHLLNAFAKEVEKLCALARKKDTSCAELLSKLWNLENVYNELEATLSA